MRPSIASGFLALPVLLALGACAVGPDFVEPSLDAQAGYLPGGKEKTLTSVIGQKVAYGADVPGRWWELFRNKYLDQLMARAVANNPSIGAARAALKQANEAALAERGSLLPQLSASGSAARGNSTTPGSVGVYTLYTLTASASYSLDLFGGNRRSVEAAKAAAEAQGYAAEATYLTVTASLARAVIQEASYRAQIDAEREIIGSYKALLDVLSSQVSVGTSSRANLLQQQASLAQAQASLPALQKTLAQQQNAIAVLAGEFPSGYEGRPFRLSALRLPHALPISVPSALVRQRPDIRNAEALLHQASANIGVATANMLPDVSLSASLPTSAEKLSGLFDNSAWSLAASVTQPLFEGGRLLHSKRAAEAAYEQALANYRSTVLSAFRDVADALKALQHDREALAGYLAAEKAARDSLDLAQSLFKAGTGTYTDVLSAQTTYQNARLNRASAEADRYLDAVALFEALGGGWWNRPDNLVALANTDPRKTMPSAAGVTK